MVPSQGILRVSAQGPCLVDLVLNAEAKQAKHAVAQNATFFVHAAPRVRLAVARVKFDDKTINDFNKVPIHDAASNARNEVTLQPNRKARIFSGWVKLR